MEPDLRCNRRNVVKAAAETWRPPLFIKPDTPVRKLAASLRRFVDLQAGSIWRDLAGILPHARGNVLDVGCGAQPYRDLFTSEAKYLGIDTVAAEAHFGYRIPETIYFEGDVWPVENDSMDFVLCTEILEHIPDSAQFLMEAYRALRPGGTLLITVPFAARWHFIPYDFWRFTPSGLERLLVAAGFAGIRVYARGNSVTVACYKVMALVLRLMLPQIRFSFLSVVLRILSLPFIPILVILAVVANISLRGQGGNDCLGYTALAVKNRI